MIHLNTFEVIDDNNMNNVGKLSLSIFKDDKNYILLALCLKKDIMPINIPIYDFAKHWFGSTLNTDNDIYLASNYYDDYNNVDISISISNNQLLFDIVKYPECYIHHYKSIPDDEDIKFISRKLESYFRGSMTSGLFKEVYEKEYKK